METTRQLKPLASASYRDGTGSELRICSPHMSELSSKVDDALKKLHKYMDIPLGSDYKIHLTERYVTITVLDAQGNPTGKSAQIQKDEKGSWSNVSDKRQQKVTDSVNLIFRSIKEQATQCQSHPMESKKESKNDSSTPASQLTHSTEPESSEEESDEKEELEKSKPPITQASELKKTSSISTLSVTEQKSNNSNPLVPEADHHKKTKEEKDDEEGNTQSQTNTSSANNHPVKAATLTSTHPENTSVTPSNNVNHQYSQKTQRHTAQAIPTPTNTYRSSETSLTSLLPINDQQGRRASAFSSVSTLTGMLQKSTATSLSESADPVCTRQNNMQPFSSSMGSTTKSMDDIDEFPKTPSSSSTFNLENSSELSLVPFAVAARVSEALNQVKRAVVVGLQNANTTNWQP